MSRSLIEIKRAKRKMAREFWSTLGIDISPIEFLVSLSNAHGEGSRNEKYPNRSIEALNSLVGKLGKFNDAELGMLIGSKAGKTQHLTFIAIQGPENVWKIEEHSLNKKPETIILGFPYNLYHDGKSILKLNAMISILQELPKLAKITTA